MNVLDLFSGIGGFSVGLERAGFKTIAFCEIDKYCQEVLKQHWKGVKIYKDVKEVTKQKLKEDGIESPAIITGGVPCQPFSVAGRKKGTADSRYLWPEMFRIIKDFKTPWVIIENVRGLISIQDGMVFERVCTDLESQNYQVQTFNIPAAGVGAPHKRERVWVVGYSEHNGLLAPKIKRRNYEDETDTQKGQKQTFKPTRTSRPNYNEIMENSRRSSRRQQSTWNKKSPGSGTSQETEWSTDSNKITRSNKRAKTMADTESIQSRKSPESKRWEDTSRRSEKKSAHNWWNVEPSVGRVVNGVQGRTHRLKGLGNAIIPQIAEEIGNAIIKAEG
jgi:DNA (cytosine-5)-methyltransferase 1